MGAGGGGGGGRGVWVGGWSQYPGKPPPRPADPRLCLTISPWLPPPSAGRGELGGRMIDPNEGRGSGSMHIMSSLIIEGDSSPPKLTQHPFRGYERQA